MRRDAETVSRGPGWARSLRAVELDPKFAMAYARLGVVSFNSGQVAKACKYITRAYELSKDVSERERLYIVGHYNEMVTGNIPKSIETLQEAIQTYPTDIGNYININVSNQLLGQYKQGLPYAQKGVELDPQNAIAAENLLEDYLYLGRKAEVRAELEREDRMGLKASTNALATHMVAYSQLGDEQKSRNSWPRQRGDRTNLSRPSCSRLSSNTPAATGWQQAPRFRLLSKLGTPRLQTRRRSFYCRMPLARGWVAAVRGMRWWCARHSLWIRAGRPGGRPRWQPPCAAMAGWLSHRRRN